MYMIKWFYFLPQLDCTRLKVDEEDEDASAVVYYTVEERIQCFHPWVMLE